ncbi:SpoIID/LytB domain-containing protein [Candidatus Omnitrophota bacterium]
MVSKIIRIIFVSILIAALSTHSSAAYKERFVRVAILKDAKSFSLRVHGNYKLYALYTNDLLYDSARLARTKVLPLQSGIQIGNEKFPLFGIKIIPRKEATIYVNKRRYRGEIDIIREKSKLLLVVNRLNLENYIKGVLYHEVDHKWPLDVLKAQAVAARTYAYYQTKVMQKKDYDVTSDIYSQVYGGKTSEKLRTNVAVDKTYGEFLTFNGKVFPTFFHATCAGHTEDAGNLWNVDLPVLDGVTCEFCKRAPHYKWKRNLRLKTIQEKLNKEGYNIWLIKKIKVQRRNQSGRIITLEVVDRKGKSITISGKDFRLIVGPNVIKSNNYNVVMKGYYVDFIGKGWGHGVGLCQWGAYFMSRKGMKYRQILNYYYPGAKVSHEVD